MRIQLSSIKPDVKKRFSKMLNNATLPTNFFSFGKYSYFHKNMQIRLTYNGLIAVIFK